ncbi:MAG: alpha-ketoglutarate-dependent dioxygenase AlkB, partial [Aeromicrobium sp.]
MEDYFQGSLLDVGESTGISPLEAVRRTPLTRGAWVDVLPGWISGSDDLFLRLRSEVPWRAEKREMWDKVVEVP